MAFNNTPSATTTVPASVSHAIAFLTRPLILTQSPEMVNTLQSILRTTLIGYFNPTRDGRLTLSLSTSSLPPRPIFAACIASGFHWVKWMTLLGGRDFHLIIEAHTVVVTYLGPKPQTVVVWSELTLTPANRALLARLNLNAEGPQVPISKLGQQSAIQASLRATVDSARARAQTRTLAQQLLESDHEKEADEIFAMISKTAILSPTPTRERFSLDIPTTFMPMPISTSFPSPLSSPEPMSSPDSSRPSSRSSTFSTYSFSDDDESVTSASSAASFDFLASTKVPIIKVTPPATSFNKHAPTFVPRQSATSHVVVDITKKDVTKYLYQGGVSTVLTGGVMLGGGSKPAKVKADPAPKYRAPIGGKKFSAPTQNAASTNSWRRAPRV